MIGQHASPAYRIYNGDTILVTLWSSVAAAVDGFFRVVYDDGTTDTLRIDRVTTTSARAAFFARADAVSPGAAIGRDSSRSGAGNHLHKGWRRLAR